jgi:hypothetical protein
MHCLNLFVHAAKRGLTVFTCMMEHVCLQSTRLNEFLATVLTFVRPDSRMDSHVPVRQELNRVMKITIRCLTD